MPLPIFLTVAGLEVLVRTDGMRERARLRRGAPTRAFSGALLSTVSAEKRAWEGVTAPLTRAEYDALRTAAGTGGFVAVGGAGLGLAAGATLSALVTLGDVEYVPDDTDEGPIARYTVPFTIEEV